MKKFYSEPPVEESTRQASIAERERNKHVAAGRDRAYLIVIAGANVGEMYRIEEDETIIGRGVGAKIRLFDDDASRQHARLASRGGEVTLEDLGSSNGTMVNGEPVVSAGIALRDGDKITIGSTTILKFTYADNLDESFQRQMFDAAQRDGMTKLFNKRYFLERLATEIAYARRHRAPLSLALFDVDHFKAVNDTHGHLAGDAVLVKLASVAAETVRKEDVLARYGGEEFVILSRGVPATGALVLAERLRGLVEKVSVESGGSTLRVTISLGVAELAESDGGDGVALVGRADGALYEAKRGGRNRAKVAG